MKLTFNKKPKKRPAKVPVKTPEERADAIGEQLQSLKESSDNLKEVIGKLNAASIDLGEKYGELDGGQTVVKGNSWKVGYSEVSASIELDLEKCHKLLDAPLLKRVVRRVVDPKAVLRLHEDGEISDSLFKKLIKVKKPASRRVYVKPIK